MDGRVLEGELSDCGLKRNELGSSDGGERRGGRGGEVGDVVSRRRPRLRGGGRLSGRGRRPLLPYLRVGVGRGVGVVIGVVLLLLLLVLVLLLLLLCLLLLLLLVEGVGREEAELIEHRLLVRYHG